ncbi:polysaccharide pyruvyl transferase family protein [Gordonia sp. VNK21]|uniref:polysaccharide pyruvyl transferase family protein n=1 Tax=Gordonia sp. VNK21 TaxID=3382483 RepID=UPI0038D3F976
MTPTLTGLRRRARRAAESADLIYLVCPAGFPNYGDELIAQAWLRHLARHRPLATVVVDCPRPGAAALMLRRANRRAVFVNTLWELTGYAHGADRDGIDPQAPWEWVAQAASRFGPAPREGHGVDMLLRARTLHLLGGGYVNAVWPQHVSLVAALAAVARTTGARAAATGQGLLPAVTGGAAQRLSDDLRGFDIVDVRDQPSHDLIADQPGASFSGDDAWLSPAIDPERPAVAPSGRVVLCAQSDLTDDFEHGGLRGAGALAGYLTEVLDHWRVPGDRVIVIEAIPGLDMVVPGLMGERLSGAQRLSFLDVWENGLPLRGGHTWLSTRFHPHLVAAAAGEPGVAVVPKPDYYGTKHASLRALGSDWPIVAGGDLVPDRPPADGGFTADAVTSARRRKRALADRLYPRGVRLR